MQQNTNISKSEEIFHSNGLVPGDVISWRSSSDSDIIEGPAPIKKWIADSTDKKAICVTYNDRHIPRERIHALHTGLDKMIYVKY